MSQKTRSTSHDHVEKDQLSTQTGSRLSTEIMRLIQSGDRRQAQALLQQAMQSPALNPKPQNIRIAATNE